MVETAQRLKGMIAAVEAEKARVDLERRHTLARTRNAKAQRLVARLEQCDESLALLLADAAACLEAFLAPSRPTSLHRRLGSRDGGLDDEAQVRLRQFEAQAQDWFATLHDVQLGLRSAVRNLRKVQRVPVAHDVVSRSDGSTSSAGANADASLGSATKGHSLGLVLSEANLEAMSGSKKTTDGSSTSSSGSQQTARASTASAATARPLHRRQDNGQRRAKKGDASPFNFLLQGDNNDVNVFTLKDVRDESCLSLSALRLQDDGWHQLEDALRAVAVEKHAMRGQGLTDAQVDRLITHGTGLLTPRRRSETEARDAQHLTHEAMQQRLTCDSRLLDAVLRVKMEVAPRTDAMRGMQT